MLAVEPVRSYLRRLEAGPRFESSPERTPARVDVLALLLAVASLQGPSDASAPAWGGFRGTNGAGIATELRLPETLDPELNLRWRTGLPVGYSSPTVAGGRVFLTGADGDALMTMALDASDGRILWSRRVMFEGATSGKISPAASTTATDGRNVYAMFHQGGPIAYDVAGKEMWRKHLGPFRIPHGMASSPVLYGGVVLVQVDQDVGSFLVALDRRTGVERWRVDRPGVVHGYATPAVHQPTEGPAQVIVSSTLQITAYSVQDGERLWWVDGSSWQTKCVPSFHRDLCIVNTTVASTREFKAPSFDGSWEEVAARRDRDEDGRIAPSEWNVSVMRDLWFLLDRNGDGYLDRGDWERARSTQNAVGGLIVIEMGGRGNVTGTHVRWTFLDRRALPEIPSPLVYADMLFLLRSDGIFSVLDAATGTLRHQRRLRSADPYFASPVGGDAKLYLASQSGRLSVLSAADDWRELAVHDIGEEIWSTPAIAGGCVFVRSQKALYCFGPSD